MIFPAACVLPPASQVTSSSLRAPRTGTAQLPLVWTHWTLEPWKRVQISMESSAAGKQNRLFIASLANSFWCSPKTWAATSTKAHPQFRLVENTSCQKGSMKPGEQHPSCVNSPRLTNAVHWELYPICQTYGFPCIWVGLILFLKPRSWSTKVHFHAPVGVRVRTRYSKGPSQRMSEF